MPNVRFNLKRKTGKEKQLILLIFRYNGNKLVYSIGQQIPVGFWDDKKMRAKQVRNYPYQSLNNYLKKLEYNLLDAYRNYLVEGTIPTIDQLKKYLDELTNTTKVPKYQLITFIDKVIKQRNDSPNYAKSTIIKYKTVRNQLADFERQNNISLVFKNINLDFFYKFTAFLFERGQSSNSVKKSITTLKMFLNEALERGENKYTHFKSKKFSIKIEKTDFAYLGINDIEKIYHFDLDGIMEEIRDCFVLACCTGLRYSDLVSIRSKHIRKVGKVDIIDMMNIKTKIRVLIPMHPFVKSILEKYNYTLPDHSNEQMNRYIKKVCKKAGLTNPVTLTKNEGGKQIPRTFKKWETITSHTGRRSFITNLLGVGENLNKIQKMTGHTNPKQLLEYDKATLEENAVKMASTNFFNVKLKAV